MKKIKIEMDIVLLDSDDGEKLFKLITDSIRNDYDNPINFSNPVIKNIELINIQDIQPNDTDEIINNWYIKGYDEIFKTEKKWIAH